jgi:hypothetical protein
MVDFHRGDHCENDEWERDPQQADFSHLKLHVPRLTHVFLKLHELQLTFVPFLEELRTIQMMSTLAFR